MMTLHNVQFAAPALTPVKAPGPVETVAAVSGAGKGDRARNDMARDSGAEVERIAREARDRVADPSEPVGPPPAFAANVLDVERARLREGEPVIAADAKPDAVSEAKPAEGNDPAEAPQPTQSSYGGVREDAPRMLDVSR